MSMIVKQRNGKQSGPLWKGDGSRVWGDEYAVIATPGTTGKQVVFAQGIPDKGSTHPQDSGSIVTNLRPVQQTPTDWYVTVTWESNHGDNSRNSENPMDDPVKYRWDQVWVMEAPKLDLDGEAFVDAAGTPFNPPPTFRVPRLRLTIDRNEFAYSSHTALFYGNTVNASEFWGHAAGTGLMDVPTASEQFANNQSYWQITYAIEFKTNKLVDGVSVPDPWNPVKIDNKGPRYKQDWFSAGGQVGGQEIVVAADEQGVAHGGIVLLTENGLRLPEGEPMNFREFRVYRSADWSALQL